MHPEGLTVKEIAREISLPEDFVLLVVEGDHKDDFESSTNPSSDEIVYQLKE